jgi:hypothetical protein
LGMGTVMFSQIMLGYGDGDVFADHAGIWGR